MILAKLTELDTESRTWNVAFSPPPSSSAAVVVAAVLKKPVFAACGEDRKVALYEVHMDYSIRKVSELDEQQHTKTIRRVNFSSDGEYIITASFDSLVNIYRRTSGKFDYEFMATLEGHESECKSAVFNPAGDLIATCSRDKSVWVWQLENYGSYNANDVEVSVLSVLQEHSQDVKSICWHPVEQGVLVSCSYDNSIKVYTSADEDYDYDDHDDEFNCVQTISGVCPSVDGIVWDIKFDCDNGDYLFACGSDGSLKVFTFNPEVKRLAFLTSYENLHEGSVYALDVGLWNGSLIVATVGEDKSLNVVGFNPEGSSQKLDLLCSFQNAHETEINSVTIHSKEGLIATGGDDGFIKVFKMKE
jgi:WD40 repeat protein